LAQEWLERELNNIVFLGFGTVTKYIVKQIKNLYSCNVSIITDHIIPDCFDDVTFYTYRDFDPEVLKEINFVFVSWKDLGEEKAIFYNKIQKYFSSNCKVIYLSSASIYGPGELLSASFSPPSPINAYGNNKLEIENLLIQYAVQELIILRIGNLYGVPGTNDFINLVYRNIIHGEKLVLENMGNCIRDYVQIGDLVHILLKILKRNYIKVDSENVTFVDIGTGVGTSNLSLTATIEMLTGMKTTSVEFSNPVKDTITVSYQNPTKARLMFGLDFQSLLQGLIVFQDTYFLPGTFS